MKLFFVFVFPPFAVLLCGKPGLAVLNFLLTLLFWLPGMLHAWAVVSEHNQNGRHKAMIRAIVSDDKKR